MSFYLKINSEQRQANNPKIIFPGKCEGLLEIVPRKDSLGQFFDPGKGDKRVGRIFLCESPKVSLRALIPYACGFIFGSGTNLSHFANILRNHRICACIDQEFWLWASTTVENQGKDRVSAKLGCSDYREYSPQVKGQYRDDMHNSLELIVKKNIVLPLYHLQYNAFLKPEEICPQTLGSKALSVNALKNDGLPVPKTLLLNGIPDDWDPQKGIGQINTILTSVFPELGRTSDSRFIARASLCLDSQSKSTTSGMIRTAEFHTCGQFAKLLQDFARIWGELRASMPSLGLTIIVQERVPASFFGVVFTRVPWDYFSDAMIFDLSFQDKRKCGGGKIQVTLDSHKNASPNQRREDLSVELRQRLSSLFPEYYNHDIFFASFSGFLNDCLELEKRYFMPLDIEFAVTGDFLFFFTQFRNISFM